jgi:hypothetical protein
MNMHIRRVIDMGQIAFVLHTDAAVPFILEAGRGHVGCRILSRSTILLDFWVYFDNILITSIGSPFSQFSQKMEIMFNECRP